MVRSFKIRLFVFALICIGFYLILPRPLFDAPKSTVLLDESGKLLSAKIAADEQWRFPEVDSVPNQLATCIKAYEDAYFEYHPGVNPVALGRALWLNLKTGEVVSGGSTISMQVIRLSRKNPSRTYSEKLWELVLALRLEFSYSKDEILELYTSYAPYGGNIVGAETAAWRYFGRPLHQLSWSESAMLAVLPNSPALIHLGRNRAKLKAKRDALLEKLFETGHIDALTYELAVLEDIPSKPKPLQNLAYHAMENARVNGKAGMRIKSTIDGSLQSKVNERIDRYVSFLAQNEVHNACALIVELKTGEVKAYAGNSFAKESRSPYVDLVHAQRSSGSILKPFLYGGAFAQGVIHPASLLRDVPVVMDNFAPSNFNGEFEGLVPAHESLYRSLNVPSVNLLRDYGLGLFYKDLQELGFSSINRSAENYGLSLILGGAEVSLWELAQVYANQANHLGDLDSIHAPKIHFTESHTPSIKQKLINRGAWYQITQALTRVQRPGINKDWNRFISSKKIAWKTGTSHGFKDAWAIGYDREYLVAVWVGNADGEGRPGLTGVSAAGPILFELFQLLPESAWFEEPEFDLKRTTLCATSGLLPNQNCPLAHGKLPFQAKMESTCHYHKSIQVNAQSLRVSKQCADGLEHDTIVFDIDPIAGHFYWPKHPNNQPPPPFDPACESSGTTAIFDVLYPHKNSEIIVPQNLAGEMEEVQFKAVHSQTNSELFWHLDGEFLGSSTTTHEMKTALESGSHTLTVIDQYGTRIERRFKSSAPDNFSSSLTVKD